MGLARNQQTEHGQPGIANTIGFKGYVAARRVSRTSNNVRVDTRSG